MMRPQRPAAWTIVLSTAAILLGMFPVISVGHATTIGPGLNSVISQSLIGSFADTTQLEIYRVSKPLAAGTYSVSSFSFHNVTQLPATVEMAVVPFLAVLTNPGASETGELDRSYQTIWVGPQTNVNVVEMLNDPTNLLTTAYSAGVQQFTLSASAEVYAGFYNIGAARVAFFTPTGTGSGFGRSDRDVTFVAPTGPSQTLAAFSTRRELRFYAFQIDVEPASSLPPIPGDFNGDRAVDGADFFTWQENFGNTSQPNLAGGDADGDGDVDGADFVVWQTNFPTAAATITAPVPEPTSATLCLIACLLATQKLSARSRTALSD